MDKTGDDSLGVEIVTAEDAGLKEGATARHRHSDSVIEIIDHDRQNTAGSISAEEESANGTSSRWMVSS